MAHERFGRVARGLVRTAMVGALLVATALPALGHEHEAARAHRGEGQVLANGQNHPRFLADADGKFQSCEEFGDIPAQSPIGPAWYGLETAHHGPDAGTPGKADGCYMIEGGLSPLNPLSVRNPAIR